MTKTKNTQAQAQAKARKSERKGAQVDAPQAQAQEQTQDKAQASAKALRAAVQASAKAADARAKMVADAIHAERASISAILRDMYECATGTGLHTYAENIRLSICADIKSVTGKEATEYADRRAFAQAWLDALRKYSTACDDKGAYISVHAYAGMVECVEFTPSLKSVYCDVVHNWVRGLMPMQMRKGVWYERKGRTLTQVARADAQKRIDAYEARKAVAQAGAAKGRADALRVYDGKKAAEKA